MELKSVEELAKHIDLQHVGNRQSRYVCGWSGCGREGMAFVKRHKLLNHLRTHTGERPYSCSIQGCRKSFSRSDSLASHQRTHKKSGSIYQLYFPSSPPSLPLPPAPVTAAPVTAALVTAAPVTTAPVTTAVPVTAAAPVTAAPVMDLKNEELSSNIAANSKKYLLHQYQPLQTSPYPTFFQHSQHHHPESCMDSMNNGELKRPTTISVGKRLLRTNNYYFSNTCCLNGDN